MKRLKCSQEKLSHGAFQQDATAGMPLRSQRYLK